MSSPLSMVSTSFSGIVGKGHRSREKPKRLILEEREAPVSRRAGCLCHGALSRSGQNATVQGKDQGSWSSCALCTSRPPRDSDSEKHCLYLTQILSRWWHGGPGHARGCIVPSDGAKHTPKIISEMGGLPGARKVGS